MDQQLKNEGSKEITSNGAYGWRIIFSYFGAVVIAILIFLIVNVKIKYDEGSMFGFFRKNADAVSVDSSLIVTTPVKQKKKSIKTQAQIAVDTTTLSDTTIVAEDTVYYTKEQTEAELSNILNQAASVTQPEIQPENQPENKVPDEQPAP